MRGIRYEWRVLIATPDIFENITAREKADRWQKYLSLDGWAVSEVESRPLGLIFDHAGERQDNVLRPEDREGFVVRLHASREIVP